MQFNFASEKQRRIAQFSKSLKPMHRRTVKQVKDCCFVIIEERSTTAEFFQSLRARKEIPVDTHIEAPVFSLCGGSPESYGTDIDLFGDVRSTEGWSNEGWRAADDSNRFIQFVFLEKHFEMDLPRPMLFAAEAMQILRHRSGFYFMSDKPGADASTVKNYNPLRKAYVHGDVVTAAEDIAWILFDLWKFPVDARFYLTTFGGKHQWESSQPLE